MVAGVAAGVPSVSWRSTRSSTVEVSSGPSSAPLPSTTRVPRVAIAACREVHDRLGLVVEAQHDLDARTAEVDDAVAAADGASPSASATWEGGGGALVERQAFNDERDDCFALPSCREALEAVDVVVARQIHQGQAIRSAQLTLEHLERFSPENRDEMLTRTVAAAHTDSVTTAAGLATLPGAFDSCTVPVQ